jgi:hypothetical protein
MTVTSFEGDSQNPWLAEMGLLSIRHKVSTLQAWLPPYSTTVIHRDINSEDIKIPWTILFCPVGHGDLSLKLFNPLNKSLTGTQSAPSGRHGVPTLTEDNAVLFEDVVIREGEAIIFSPGKYYHSVGNTCDKWVNAISIRSISSAVLEELELLLVK